MISGRTTARSAQYGGRYVLALDDGEFAVVDFLEDLGKQPRTFTGPFDTAGMGTFRCSESGEALQGSVERREASLAAALRYL